MTSDGLRRPGHSASINHRPATRGYSGPTTARQIDEPCVQDASPTVLRDGTPSRSRTQGRTRQTLARHPASAPEILPDRLFGNDALVAQSGREMENPDPRRYRDAEVALELGDLEDRTYRA